jgi:FkbM family methyltransferase
VTLTLALHAVLRAPLKLIPKGTPMPVLSGPLRGSRWMAGVLSARSWLGTYEAENQARIVRLITRGGVFYDIGANAGYFTLLAAKAVGPNGTVIAIEPHPVNLARLRRHLAMNRGTDRVQIVEAALADEAGLLHFDVSEGTEMGRLADTGMSVRALTLDALVCEQHYPPPTACKIDVEGGELRVLQGALRTLATHRPVIFLESHTRVMDRECPALLEGLGYSIEALDRWPDEDLIRGWFIAHPPSNND